MLSLFKQIYNFRLAVSIQSKILKIQGNQVQQLLKIVNKKPAKREYVTILKSQITNKDNDTC